MTSMQHQAVPGSLLLSLMLTACLTAPAMAAPSAETLTHWQKTLSLLAENASRQPYQPPDIALPESLRTLDYDTYRQIRFNPERAYRPSESAFSVQLFHPGYLFDAPVSINMVDEDGAEKIPFDPDDYHYDGKASQLDLDSDDALGHAGFRLHYPLNSAQHADEFAVFLGASYFRLLGRNQVHGLSTRAIAVDTGLASDEEFPRFTQFWLFAPAPEDTEIHLMARLDGPSITGAYHIRLTPGDSTQAKVDATLYARQDVRKLGIAPLTSMFAWGDISRTPADDFRPNVHDSNGLLIHTGADEWLWRPLDNPPGAQTAAFLDDSPQGFGLMQRPRDFDHYQDLEADYHRRPSQWVTPDDSWGPGQIELFRYPAPDETHDNINAYWVSDLPFLAGDTRRLRYTTATLDHQPDTHRLARVSATRQGSGRIPGQPDGEGKADRRWVIDFHGGRLEDIKDATSLDLRLESTHPRLTDPQLKTLPDGGARATFRVTPSEKVTDARLALTLDGTPVSETWTLTLPAHGLSDNDG